MPCNGIGVAGVGQWEPEFFPHSNCCLPTSPAAFLGVPCLACLASTSLCASGPCSLPLSVYSWGSHISIHHFCTPLDFPAAVCTSPRVSPAQSPHSLIQFPSCLLFLTVCPSCVTGHPVVASTVLVDLHKRVLRGDSLAAKILALNRPGCHLHTNH